MLSLRGFRLLSEPHGYVAHRSLSVALFDHFPAAKNVVLCRSMPEGSKDSTSSTIYTASTFVRAILAVFLCSVSLTTLRRPGTLNYIKEAYSIEQIIMCMIQKLLTEPVAETWRRVWGDEKIYRGPR